VRLNAYRNGSSSGGGGVNRKAKLVCRVDDGHMKDNYSQESFTRNQNSEKKNPLGRLIFTIIFLNFCSF
jgi:hypothetical protein